MFQQQGDVRLELDGCVYISGNTMNELFILPWRPVIEDRQVRPIRSQDKMVMQFVAQRKEWSPQYIVSESVESNAIVWNHGCQLHDRLHASHS